jgi:hypothetical protein
MEIFLSLKNCNLQYLENTFVSCGLSACRYFSFPNFDGGTRVKTKRRTDEGGEKVPDGGGGGQAMSKSMEENYLEVVISGSCLCQLTQSRR